MGQKYGYHEDKVYSLSFTGSEGSAKMKAITSKLHENPFIEVNGLMPCKVDDFYKQVSLESKKETPINLPKSDVVKLYFEDGTNVAVRPSGTEPKIKFYIGVVGKSLEDARSKPDKIYEEIKKVLGI